MFGSIVLQVSPKSHSLPTVIHDPSLDILSGHDSKEHCGREGGTAKGDHQNYGPEERHLLAELGSVVLSAPGSKCYFSCSDPEGDLKVISV